jgi:multiple sugar transport system permease protein
MAGIKTAPEPDSARQPGPDLDAGHGGRWSRRKGISERGLARLFVSPSILLMALVALFPVIYAVVTSLFAYQNLQQEEFTGLSNYVDAIGLPRDRFWDALWFTFMFTVISVAFEFAIGMGFALLMNQAFRGRGITRASILIPWVIPTVIAAQMWFFMFNISPGFINNLLGLEVNWLGQSGTATFAIIFADVWKTAPFVALLLLAGLQTIPNEVYESGRVDGAGMFSRFFYITLPLLRPAILVALLFRTVDALRVYDLPQVMTGGAFNTESLAILVQQHIVRTPDPGLAAALSTITFGVVLGVGLIFVKLLGRDLVIGREEAR